MERELSQLEQVLRDQLAAHERMSALLEQKLTALRRAEHARVAQLTQEENGQVQRLAALEKQRRNEGAAERIRTLDGEIVRIARDDLRLGAQLRHLGKHVTALVEADDGTHAHAL